MAFSILTISILTFSILTFSILTFNIAGLIVNSANVTVRMSTLTTKTLITECHIFMNMLSVVMPIATLLSDIAPSSLTKATESAFASVVKSHLRTGACFIKLFYGRNL